MNEERTPLVRTHRGRQMSQPEADLLVDALIGYGLSGSSGGLAATLIRWIDEHGAPVMSLDVPSGLDGTSGEVRGEMA